MEVSPHIFTAKVMHKRLFPKVNAFRYGVYYLALPLPVLKEAGIGWRFGVNQRGLLSFHERDHGNRDGSSLHAWARNILNEYRLNEQTAHIMLITMPRVLGYVFNPVSFYFCLDEAKHMRAVLAEVHNTFGEQHVYVCARADREPVTPDEWLAAEKHFHVSPFLKRMGSYNFRFALKDEQLGIWIDYYDEKGEKELITSLVGSLEPLTRQNLTKAFRTHPLVTMRTVWLIHKQALKLFVKGVRYLVKPVQKDLRMSATANLTKM